jgi:hypothetical protein
MYMYYSHCHRATAHLQLNLLLLLLLCLRKGTYLFSETPFLNFTVKANDRPSPYMNSSSHHTARFLKYSRDDWYMLCWHVTQFLQSYAPPAPPPPPSYCSPGYVPDINVTMLYCSAVKTNVSLLKENFKLSHSRDVQQNILHSCRTEGCVSVVISSALER